MGDKLSAGGLERVLAGLAAVRALSGPAVVTTAKQPPHNHTLG
jgi:hypothetical protein